MFPGFWYAGKPIGLGIGPVLAVIWKFFAASVGAGCTTALILRAVPAFAMTAGPTGALLRMASVSLLFFGLYFVGVILLHQGPKPLNETARLLRDLLPENMSRPASSASFGAEVSGTPALCGEGKSQSNPVLFSGDVESKA
jgi:hypothetical protein